MCDKLGGKLWSVINETASKTGSVGGVKYQGYLYGRMQMRSLELSRLEVLDELEKDGSACIKDLDVRSTLVFFCFFKKEN